MPWCPKCKTEYREGVLTCVDCGSELVNEQPADYEYVPLYSLEQEHLAQKVIDYFEYSKIDSHYEYSDEEQAYVVLVRDTDLKQAKKLFQAFYTVELEQLIAEEAEKKAKEMLLSTPDFNEVVANDPELAKLAAQAADDESNDSDLIDETSAESNEEEDYSEESESEFESFAKEEEEQKTKTGKLLRDGGAYEKKSDKCKDLKSTAFTFFLFGIAMAVFFVLNIAKVITYLGNPLQYILFGTMTVGFIIVGITSVQRAKKAAADAVLEEETTKKLMDWMTDNITSEIISSFRDASDSEEIGFMKVMDGIKTMVTKNFGELDDAYLDYITEEYYNNHFDA